MNPTLFITEKEIASYTSIDPYTHLAETKPPDLFANALHPYFNYYSKKVSVSPVNDTTPLQELPETLEDNCVYITLAEGSVRTKFLNTFKNRNKKIFYIDATIATRDIERTWKTIVENVPLKDIAKVLFIYPHFTKMVHAYRITTIYKKEVEDKTY